MSEGQSSLKPCPWCGGPADVGEDDGIHGVVFAFCTRCAAQGPFDADGDKGEAADLWNTRTELRFVTIDCSLTGTRTGEYRAFRGDECLGDVSPAIRDALESAQAEIARLTEVLEDARGAIASLDTEALGMATMAFGMPGVDVYPIRDELLAKIDAAIKGNQP